MNDRLLERFRNHELDDYLRSEDDYDKEKEADDVSDRKYHARVDDGKEPWGDKR